MVEKKKVEFYFYVFLIAFLSVVVNPYFLYANKSSNAVGDKKNPKIKKSKTSKTVNKDSTKKYVVKRGDTFAKVAKKYGCSVETLKKANPDVNPRKIKAGNIINIPFDESCKNGKGKNKEDRELVYRVKKGDTLFSIAKRYNLSEEEIKKLNKINDDHIVAGMSLLIKNLNVKNETEKTEKSYSLTDVNEDDFGEETTEEGKELSLLDKEELKISSSVPPYTLSKDKLEKMLSYSLDFLGTDYKYGGSSITAIDCSAFVRTVFKEVNISLPRTSREQFTLGVEVTMDELREGDLLFFAKKKRINHVGIYIGSNMFVHAARRGKGVIVTKLDSPYVKKHLVGAKRLFSLEDETTDSGTKKDLSLVEKPLIN